MERVMEEMKKSDLEKKEKVRIGRRKGINEEKKKMGINLESLYEEMQRNRESIVEEREEIEKGEIQGEVGNLENIEKRVEEYV